MALPYKDMARARPFSDQVLVRRARQGYIWQGIIQIPTSYTSFTKNMNALVVAIGKDVDLPGLDVGDVVWLSSGVTRRTDFVDEEKDSPFEPSIYSCYPMEVMWNLGEYVGEVSVAESSEEPTGRYQRETSLDRALHDRRADEIG